FLPFEGAGAESTWKLDLPNPQDHPAFDYATISDVILHIRYTARQGVDATKVTAALDDLFQQANQQNLTLLFSLRHDFPSEWLTFVSGTGDFAATIRKEYFPYFTQRKSITINRLELYASDVKKHHETGAPDVATEDLDEKKEFRIVAAADGPGPNQVLVRSSVAQVFLVVRYSLD
ncbi:MAG: hypothetical protein ND866_11180, partial [Pyrinomonadaceae bacterium]|nr:hypothetical protein [Pyrinomonadaceae bacterium]